MNKCKINRLLFDMVVLAAAGTFLALALSDASAASRWYTARTVNGRTQPLSAGTETIILPDGRIVGVNAASVTNGLIDLVISLYNNPQGDDNGNTQDTDPASASQDAYEKIVQYFADGVYEATDGAHSIRNVRIYRNASRQDADVIWDASGHPGAWYMNQNNIAANINMYDRFSGHNFTNNAAEHEVGGYTLAHEFGHYFYGVLDEYCRWDGGWVGLAANEKTRPCIMNDQWSAAGRSYNWLNHSIMYNTASLVYADYECRNRTAQYQHYNNGAWVILSRNPTNDPLDTARRQWLRTNRGMRMYYPELAGVAPSGTNPPIINLSSATPLADLASRQNLNVIWMGSNIVVEIIIDHSGSMDYPGKMDGAKAAAQLLVDQIPDRSAVGVIAFDDTVSTISSIIVVTSVVQRASIKSAIAAITADGYTAIGDAAFEGLSQIQAFGHTNFTRVAFLLSDGQSNTGTDPLAAAAAYQTAQIPIMTFGYGDASDIDSRLLTMAGMTGGRYYYSPGSLAQVAAAFQDAYAAVVANQNLADGTFMASATAAGPQVDATVSVPFYVDSTIANLSATIGYAFTNTVAVHLHDPNGTVYPATSTNASSTEKVLSFSISSPAAGQWSVMGTASSGSSLRYQINAGVNQFSYYLSAVSLNGDTVDFPTPIEIVARLTREVSINGAVVTAIITDPETNSTTLTLTNSAAGTYSGVYLPSNGIYSIVVQANNSAGTATYTWSDILPASEDNGEIGSLPADTPESESFNRVSSFQVTASGAYYATPPVAPSTVTASDGTALDAVNITWTASYYVSIYEIWRNTSDSTAGAVKIAQVDQTYNSYIDDAVSAGTRYYYWVKAVNVAGSSAFSSSDQGWPLFGPAIRVNEASSVTLGVGSRADVTVLLRTGSYTGLNCDWWVVAYAETLGAIFYMDSNGQWQQAFGGFADVRPVYQGPLFDITTPYTVFSYNALPAGTYKFYFGLDTNVDGQLDADAVYYNMAVLNVQ